MSGTETRHFHIGDILSVTTGRLVSPRLMGGIYDILNYMTGDDLYTHQLPRAMRECKPALLAQHPHLAWAKLGEITPENHAARLAELAATYGETLPVTPLAGGAHERRDPVEELADMLPDTPIIAVTGHQNGGKR